MNNKKKIIISLLGILGLVAIIAGTSVAFFNFSRSGSTENTIDLGSISFHYEEISGKGRGINLIDAFPVESDEDAKNSNDYFDFRITANSNIAEIPYVVAARLSEDSNLDTSVVKIYLTKLEGNSETELLYTTIDQLEEKNFVGSYIDKVLYRTTVPVNGQSYEANYRLRMWIAEGTNFNSGLYDNKKLTLTVNVYTNDGTSLTQENVTKPTDTSIKMVSANNTYLLAESTEETVDYEVTVPYSVNTISFDTTTRNIAATTNVTELGTSLSMAEVTRLSNSSTYNLVVGDNYFKTRVTSADGTKTEDYTLKVNREMDRDNNLTYLAVDGYSFTEDFDEDTTTYTTVGLEADTITITGNKSSDVATIEGTGEKTLTNWGENRFEVTVTPQNPNEQPKVYTVIVNRVRPTAPDIIGGSSDWFNTNPTITINEPGTAISGIDGYEYYKTTSTTAPDDNTVATGTITESPYSLEVSDEGTTYIYYRVVSANGNKSVWSNAQMVKLDKGPTKATLTSAPSTKNQITANYTATTSLSDVKSIKCYIGTTNNPTTEVNPTGNNCVFTGLSQDTTYYFKKCTTSNSDATTCSAVSSKPTAGHVYQFPYNGTTGADGSVQSWTVPYSGTYKLEAWGAQGGNSAAGGYNGYGGLGGYSQGTTTLAANSPMFIATGGMGTTTTCPAKTKCSTNGGYNGGGTSSNTSTTYDKILAIGSGGGATSIGYVNGTIGNGITADTANQVLVIAGGGGGSAANTTVQNYNSTTFCATSGGNGGGSTYTCNTHALGCSTTAYHSVDGIVPSMQKCEYSNNPIFSNGNGIGAGGGVESYVVVNSMVRESASSGGLGLNNISGGTMQSGVRSGHGYAQITVESID